MDSNLLRQFSQVIHRKKARFNIRLAIFSFFFIVASILWYLNKLSNEYTTDLMFPVKIMNLPRGKVIVGEPVRKITLRVTAFGYYLLRYKIGSSLMPITIDLNQTVLSPQSGSDSHFFIITSRLRRSITTQLSSEFQLETVLPDTLFFEFTNLVEKRVKVKPILSLTYEKQFMKSGQIVVSPDSITISGPKSIIDTISEVCTLPIERNNLFLPTEVTGTLPPIDQVGFSHRKVNLLIPVEKYTQASITIPVEINNLPDSVDIKLLPRTVLLKCNVVLSRYSNLNSRYFTAQVDYSTIDRNLGNRLRVSIIRKPDFVRNFDFEPKYVEYIIEKR